MRQVDRLLLLLDQMPDLPKLDPIASIASAPVFASEQSGSPWGSPDFKDMSLGVTP